MPPQGQTQVPVTFVIVNGKRIPISNIDPNASGGIPEFDPTEFAKPFDPNEFVSQPQEQQEPQRNPYYQSPFEFGPQQEQPTPQEQAPPPPSYYESPFAVKPWQFGDQRPQPKEPNPWYHPDELIPMGLQAVGGVGGSIAGGTAGSIVPFAGTAAGVAAGGAGGAYLGNAAAQGYRYLRGLQPEGYNLTSGLVEAGLGAVPFMGKAPAMTAPARQWFRHAATAPFKGAVEGGVLGGASPIAHSVFEKGELPSWEEVKGGMKGGAIFGAGTAGAFSTVPGVRRGRAAQSRATAARQATADRNWNVGNILNDVETPNFAAGLADLPPIRPEGTVDLSKIQTGSETSIVLAIQKLRESAHNASTEELLDLLKSRGYTIETAALEPHTSVERVIAEELQSRGAADAEPPDVRIRKSTEPFPTPEQQLENQIPWHEDVGPKTEELEFIDPNTGEIRSAADAQPGDIPLPVTPDASASPELDQPQPNRVTNIEERRTAVQPGGELIPIAESGIGAQLNRVDELVERAILRGVISEEAGLRIEAMVDAIDQAASGRTHVTANEIAAWDKQLSDALDDLAREKQATRATRRATKRISGIELGPSPAEALPVRPEGTEDLTPTTEKPDWAGRLTGGPELPEPGDNFVDWIKNLAKGDEATSQPIDWNRLRELFQKQKIGKLTAEEIDEAKILARAAARAVATEATESEETPILYHGTRGPDFENLQPTGGSGFGLFPGWNHFSENPEYTSLYSVGETAGHKRNVSPDTTGARTIAAKGQPQKVLDLTKPLSDEDLKILSEAVSKSTGKPTNLTNESSGYLFDWVNRLHKDLPYDAVKYNEHGQVNWAIKPDVPLKTPQGVPLNINKPDTPRLPESLRGAKPRFNIGTNFYLPQFASDLDKALYIIAQTKPSKQDAQYLKFVMDNTGLDEAAARELGGRVRQQVRRAIDNHTAAGGESGSVDIPIIASQQTSNAPAVSSVPSGSGGAASTGSGATQAAGAPPTQTGGIPPNIPPPGPPNPPGSIPQPPNQPRTGAGPRQPGGSYPQFGPTRVPREGPLMADGRFTSGRQHLQGDPQFLPGTGPTPAQPAGKPPQLGPTRAPREGPRKPRQPYVEQNPQLVQDLQNRIRKALEDEALKRPNPGGPREINKILNDMQQVIRENPDVDPNGIIRQVLGANKALLTSWDLSAPGRQGKAFILNKEWWQALPGMVKAWGSKGAADLIQKAIEDHPSGYFKRGVSQSGKPTKSFAELVGLQLSETEEMFASVAGQSFEKYSGIGKSSRAHTAFLNKLRSDMFANFMESAKAAGRNPETDLNLAKSYATFINDATGRGSVNIGKWKLERNISALNDAFFAPKNMAGQIRTWNNVLNPIRYYQHDPVLRKQALKSLFAVAGVGMMTAEAADQLPGVTVSHDPTSPDLYKIKIGQKRLDFFGGYQQPMAAALQFMLGAKTPTSGKNAGRTQDLSSGGYYSRASEAEKFFVNRLSPVGSFTWAWMRGREFDGKPFEVKRALYERTLPIVTKDLTELAQSDPAMAALLSPLLVGGLLSSQVYTGR